MFQRFKIDELLHAQMYCYMHKIQSRWHKVPNVYLG